MSVSFTPEQRAEIARIAARVVVDAARHRAKMTVASVTLCADWAVAAEEQAVADEEGPAGG